MDIKFYNPTEPQKDMLRLVYEDQPFMSITIAGRQTGKTFAMMMDSMMRGINNPKTRMMWISPIQEQATKVMKDIESYFIGREELFNKLFKRFDRKSNEIWFYNGSFIKFRSAESGDSLRGMTLDFVYADEFAFFKQVTLNEVVLPMLTRTNGRIWMSSTFNGRNWAYDLYEQGQIEENHQQIKSIKRTYLDLNDPQVTRTVEGIRKSMTAAEFAQEFMCEPVAAGALFSGVYQAVKEPPTDYERVYIGADIGVAQDYTVMTAMTENGEVIEIERFNYKEESLDYEEFKHRILDFYHKYDDKLMAFYFEMNNNDLLFDDLTSDEKIYKMIPFLTTAKSKPDIIRNLVKQFEQGSITIPDNKDLIRELFDFKSKRNSITGNLQFSNTDGSHDDMVMSLAITAWCLKEETDGGVTMFL